LLDILFSPEDGDSKLLRIIDNLVHDYMASHLKSLFIITSLTDSNLTLYSQNRVAKNFKQHSCIMVGHGTTKMGYECASKMKRDVGRPGIKRRNQFDFWTGLVSYL
jgi:hypothetical protein